MPVFAYLGAAEILERLWVQAMVYGPALGMHDAQETAHQGTLWPDGCFEEVNREEALALDQEMSLACG